MRRSADMRYGEQIFEIPVDLDGIEWSRPDLLRQMADAFHARHQELYTYALRDQEAVLVNARVAVIGELPALPTEPPRQRECAVRRPARDGAATSASGVRSRSSALTIWPRARSWRVPPSSNRQPLRFSSALAIVRRSTPLGWLDVAVGER